MEERRLTPEQKRRVGALITEPELKGVVLRLVRAWGHRQEPLPPLPPECLPLLEQLALQGDTCGEAVRLLAAAGPAGVALLFRLVETDRQDWNAPIRKPRPCEWLFDFGRWELKPEARATLEKLAQLANLRQGNIRVEGHTDNVGTAQFNQGADRTARIASRV
jgi:hypothetical protein